MDEGGGGSAVDEWGEGDASAVGFDDLPADDLFFFIVIAFDEDIGADGVEEWDGGVVVEEDDVVDALEFFEE